MVGIITDKTSRQLLSALKDYIEKCYAERQSRSERKEKGPIPNVCGYCRHMGVGIHALEERLREDADTADKIATFLEDAAINADPAAGTLSHCIKLTEEMRGERGGGLTVIFSHPDGEEGSL